MKPDLKLAARYGLICGVIMAIVGIITYVFSDQLFSSFWKQSVFGILMMGLIVFLVVWFGITYRKNRGGNILFGEAFVAIFVIYAVCMGVNYFTNYVINNVLDKEYQSRITEMVKKNVSEFMEKMGAPDEEIEKSMKKMDEDMAKSDAVSLLIGFAKSLALGALLSLIVALFIKRKPEAVVPPPAS